MPDNTLNNYDYENQNLPFQFFAGGQFSRLGDALPVRHVERRLALGPIPNGIDTIGLTENYTVSGMDVSISALTLTFVLQNGVASDLSGYLRLGDTTGSPGLQSDQ